MQRDIEGERAAEFGATVIWLTSVRKPSTRLVDVFTGNGLLVSDYATSVDLAAFFSDVSLFWRRKLLHSRFSPPPQREALMAADETKKCAHPVCTCRVTSEQYCSPQCEAMEHVPDVDCKCPHTVCAGRTEYAAHA